MQERIFETLDGLKLVIRNRKSAVFFEVVNNIKSEKDYNFVFKFGNEVFNELVNYIEKVANNSWGNLNPKEADSMGADYFEYYDRELDNNGYLRVRNNELFIERPSLESCRLYKFNKKKMESFIYDLKQI